MTENSWCVTEPEPNALKAIVAASGHNEADSAIILAELEKLGYRVEAKRCFACGAKSYERCNRSGAKDCGREFFGGSRQGMTL